MLAFAVIDGPTKRWLGSLLALGVIGCGGVRTSDDAYFGGAPLPPPESSPAATSARPVASGVLTPLPPLPGMEGAPPAGPPAVPGSSPGASGPEAPPHAP